MKIILNLASIGSENKRSLLELCKDCWEIKEQHCPRVHPDKISSNQYCSFSIMDYLDKCRQKHIQSHDSESR